MRRKRSLHCHARNFVSGKPFGLDWNLNLDKKNLLEIVENEALVQGVTNFEVTDANNEFDLSSCC